MFYLLRQIVLCAFAVNLSVLPVLAQTAQAQDLQKNPLYSDIKLPEKSAEKSDNSSLNSSDRAPENGPFGLKTAGKAVNLGFAVAGAIALPAFSVPFAVIALINAWGLFRTVKTSETGKSKETNPDRDFIWDQF